MGCLDVRPLCTSFTVSQVLSHGGVVMCLVRIYSGPGQYPVVSTPTVNGRTVHGTGLSLRERQLSGLARVRRLAPVRR